uniref:Uncharacterized protein n=1 Tax=Anguilla anguilla TaxID=7936 RepID=A0A0E9VX84_ANGAN
MIYCIDTYIALSLFFQGDLTW